MNFRILPNFLLVFICFSTALEAKPVEIRGFVTNSSQYKYVYLNEFFGTETIKKDSVPLIKNSFSFKSKQGYPRGFYQIKFTDNVAFSIILSDEDIDIKADLNNLNSTLIISGSKENDGLQQYKVFSTSYFSLIQNLQNEANKLMPLQNTDRSGFQSGMEKLKNKYDSLFRSQQDFYKGLSAQYKDYFVGKFINAFVIDSTSTKDNFIKTSDFNDAELLRGDVLNSKVNLFFQQFVDRSLDAWQAEAKNLLTKTKDTKGQEVLYLTLLNIFASADMDFTIELANEYAKTFPKSAKAKSVLASLPKSSPRVGEVAPDIMLPDPEGKNLSLASLKGKIVLLDFWASWCGPCRMENPNVVNVFNKYKDKGFMIYSVSLDSDKAKWLQAIEKDGLKWLHVSDLKNWKSEGAKLYGVQSIPATFLIDKDGKIIAKNLRGEKLEEELKKIFEKNLTN